MFLEKIVEHPTLLSTACTFKDQIFKWPLVPTCFSILITSFFCKIFCTIPKLIYLCIDSLCLTSQLFLISYLFLMNHSFLDIKKQTVNIELNKFVLLLVSDGQFHNGQFSRIFFRILLSQQNLAFITFVTLLIFSLGLFARLATDMI